MTDLRAYLAAALKWHLPNQAGQEQHALDVGDKLLSLPNIAIVDSADFQQLLSVADLYVNAFSEDEMMTLPERMRLQMIEDIVKNHTAGAKGE